MSARPRILFLNRSYWPDSEATGQLLTALCEDLSEDFEVHVLAGKPNAAAESGWQDTRTRHGVTIHRVAHTTFPKRRMVLKAVNFLSFVRSAARYVDRIPRPDVVVFETDPFLLPFVARRWQRRTGCRCVGYLQDIYPDVAVALGKVRNSWMIRRLRTALFRIYRQCDRMVVLSRDMRELLIEGAVAPDRVHIIPNWADTKSIQPVAEPNPFVVRHQLQDKFVVMYSGNLGLTQRLEEFVQAANLLKAAPDIQLVLIGQGARRQDLEQQVRSLRLHNVLFLDYQPRAELANSLSAADLHLVPLNAALAQCLMPSKIYGIMAAGRPWLTNAPVGTELHDLTLKHQLGLVVEPGSPERIARAIRKAKTDLPALRQMGINARRLVEAHYTQQHAVTAFRDLLNAVLR